MPDKHQTPADKEKAVHRLFHLASPLPHGADVGALQSNINKQFKHLKVDCEIGVDDEFGPHTLAAAQRVALSLGVMGEAQDKLERNTVSEGVQKLIRKGRRRTKDEVAAGRKRDDYRQQLRKRFDKTAGERAIEKSNGLVGVHETEENYGGMVTKMITFTGYGGPVAWCGCCACWIVVKLGGAKIPTRIRLGYAGNIVNDALAGTNGLRAVPVAEARPGDIASLWGFGHIVTVRGPVKNGMVPTREGNTSAADGSQSNGGEVADKERPASDFDRGIVARPDWG